MGIIAMAPPHRPPRSRARWGVAWRPVAVLLRAEGEHALTSMGPYTTVAAAAALAGFVLQNHLHRVQEDGLVVLSDPFALPLYAGVMLLSIFVAVAAATGTARDREHGAVELLCYGPVTPLSYLLAKVGAHTLLYAAMLGLLLGTYLLFAIVTGLHVRTVTLLAAVLSLGPAGASAGLGVLLAAFLRRVRSTVLVTLGATLSAVGLQVAREVLARLPTPAFHVNPVSVLRWAAFAVSSVTQWVLPFGYVDREVTAILRGDLAGAGLTTGFSILYAAAVVALAAWVLDATGVRR